MVKLFDGINPKNREKLEKIFETQTLHVKKNSSILESIHGSRLIGYVVNGYLQMIKNDPNGTKAIIDEILDEDTFNLTFNYNEYDIVAKEPSDIILIDYQNIININDFNKDYYLQFLKNLLEITMTKTEEKNERIEILTKKTIRNRLLEYFTIMSNKHGTKFIYLPFNYTDLADYLAIDRCAMSRELKNLKEEGFIEIKGKRITLLYEKYSSSDPLINI